MKSFRPQSEVAMASMVLKNELPTKQTKRRDVDNVVASAKRLQRLQTKRNTLRRQLRQVEADIKHEKKMLRAFAGATK